MTKIMTMKKVMPIMSAGAGGDGNGHDDADVLRALARVDPNP